MTNSRTKKILITGVSGLLGANLAARYGAEYETTGWYGTRDVQIKGVTIRQVDLADGNAIETNILELQPDLVIHCGAATDVEWCEKNPERARIINEDSTRILAEQSVNLGAKFVFLSSDSVFDGKLGNYVEADTPVPRNVYASGKVRCEKFVRDLNPDSLIVRSYFYGYSPSGSRSLLEWVLNKLDSRSEITGFTDAIFSPVSVQTFARALDAALLANTSGYLHIASDDAISKYEFARLSIERFGGDVKSLHPITLQEAGFESDRPVNTSLNNELLRSIMNGPVTTVAQDIANTSVERLDFV